MTKLKITHTQGPWGASASCSSDFRNIRHISDADGNTIADVRYVEGFSRDEMLATARLIAAAPELLAALEGVMFGVAGVENSPAYKAARAVIAKVKKG